MTSTSNNQITSKHVSHLLRIIESRKWATFEAVILGNPKAFQLISSQVSKCPEFNGMTLLHACVRHSPPLYIVNKMIELCPHLTGARDCLDRTPLHVAVGTGASASLVKLLAQACPSACDVQDEDGMTPLHLACDSSCEIFEDGTNDNDKPRAPPSYDVVRVLLSVSLHAATLEDEDGMSALEYAIISDGSMQVVSCLQAATQVAAKQMPKKRRLDAVPLDHSSPWKKQRICSAVAV